MGFKDLLEKIGEKSKERKEKIRVLDENLRLQKLVEDRQKNSDERELERFMEEERQEQISEALKVMRKKRDQDIRFNHNPLNVKNITSGTEWEVMKEKNMFAGKNSKSMFSNQGFIHKNNPNLLKNNRSLMK